MTDKEVFSQQQELPEWTRQVDPDLVRKCLASGLRPLDVPGGWAREVPVEERTMTVPEIIDYYRNKAREAGLKTPLGMLHSLLASHIEGVSRARNELR